MQVCWPRRGPSVALAAFFVALLCLGARLADGLNKDPYKVLGVSKDVDDAALKRAYKKLALKYHPDKNPAGQSRFIEIQQAYEILSDPEKKRNYDLGGSSGGGGGYHHGGFHYQYQSRSSFHEQQQRQYQQYQQYQQSQEQAYDRALPSNTSFLTVSNFRSLVFHGGRPWLALIYSEHSSTCREFSPTWEALWRSLGGTAAGAGARDGAVVGLGRIHVRYQRSLVSWISKADSPFSGGGIKEGDVPVILAVPSGCGDPNCFVRYKGPLRLSSLQDFVAERLLHLPRVVQLEPPGVEAFLRRASPFRVVMVAFGRGGGHGSLALRLLASRQKEMLTVVRAHVQEGSSGATSASAWRSALNLSSSPSYGTLVFLRGPGTLPRTLQMSGGKGDIQSVIDSDSGVLWHEVPPLRPNTGASLGCLWGRAAAASGQSMIETCVLAIARRGPALEEARRKMAVLGRHLAAAAAQRDPSVSSAATAYMAGKLRLAFVEANTQRQVCKALLGEPKAMRRSAFTPPPGTNSAGRAAAVQAALLAAAAKSPELVEAVCGPSLPVRLMDGARTQLASALKYVGFEHMSAAVRPKMPSAVLVILRPTADGSSWFRGGGAQHSRNGRRVFLHAVNSDYDMAAVNGQRGSSDNDLGRLIAPWINSMHADPDRQMHASTAFPPALQPDEEPGVIEYVASRVYERGTQLLHMLLTVGGFASEDGSEVSAESQLVNVAVVLAVLALIHYALWRRPAGAPRPPASLREDARRRAEAARAAARAHPERPSGTSHPPSSEGPDDPSAAARRGRSPSPSPVVNRRALSPSWAQGRRGEDDGDRRAGVSDDVAGGGGHVDDDVDACFLGACDGDEAGSTEAEAEVAAGARPSEGRAAGQGRRGRSGRGEQEEEEEEGGKGTGSPAEEDGAGAQGDGRVSDDGWQHVQVGAVRGGGSGED